MAQFTINTITRILDDERNLQISQDFGLNCVLTIQGDNHPFSAARGVHPAAFRYDANNIPLSVTGSYVFPVGQANYRLRGTGPDGFQITSQQNFIVTGTSTGAAVSFTVERFSHQGGVPGSPFKVNGNWTWTILRAADNSPMVPSAATPLEIYFMFGDHNLPYLWNERYVLELISRLFPNYGAVAGQPWANLEGNIIRNAVRQLWNHGERPLLYYDSEYISGGASRHLIGENFNLETMMGRTVNTCNCYDLAALVKVALGSFGLKPDPLHPGNKIPVVNGVELIADTPWGYIPAGPLFGWENGPARICNNPFWISRFDPPTGAPPVVPRINAPPNVARTDPNRTSFHNHCYVVFNDHTGVRRVIDICHATINPAGEIIIPDGTLDVANYRAQAIDIDIESRVVNVTLIRA